MVALVPAPSTLGRASPALGPWFTDGAGGIPGITLALPNADLSISVTLRVDDQWHAPVGCLRSYFIAQPMEGSGGHRPAGIAALRQADGSAAFDENDLVVLLTLLPEVELRLQTLTNNLPAADAATGAPPAPNPLAVPTRPRIRYIAMSIPASAAGTVAQLETMRTGEALPSGGNDVEKAAFVGLSVNDSGALINGAQPTTELRLPADPRSPALQNGSGGSLNASLWAFDYRGRPVDAGAVATWWSHLASGNATSVGTFNNLWADTDASGNNQRTATASAGRVVHLASANEGPLVTTSGSDVLDRMITSSDLQAITDTNQQASRVLFSTTSSSGTATNIRFSAAPADPTDSNTPDTAPLPRAALVPHANYGTTVQFTAWTNNWPTTLNRDFARVTVTDIEHQLTGLTRADDNQAPATTRIAASRNTTATPFLTQTDNTSAQAIATLAPGTNPRLVSPVMDRYWGSLTPTPTTTATPPDTLDYTVRPLVGEGSTTIGNPPHSSESQRVVVHLTNLPTNVWIRCWPLGLDTDTGRRFRQDGGGAQSDANGEAFVVMAIPDGMAAPDASETDTDTDTDPTQLTFDALMVAGSNSRYYTEQRYDRPPTVTGNRVALDSVPDESTMWLAEVGGPFNRGQNTYGSGMTLLAIPDNRDDDYALVDLTTLAENDIAAGTLRGACNVDGISPTLAITTPAYVATDPGDLVPPDAANASGDPDFGNASIIHHERDLLNDLPDFGRPVPTMERREVAGVNAGTDTTGTAAAGFVGSTSGRALNHEVPPSQLGHPGMPASAEIHGTGITVTGPAILPLTGAVNERMAKTLGAFASLAAQPLPGITDGGGTTPYVSVLDTLTFGVTGDAIIRGLLGTDFFDNFTPGNTWQTIKGQIEGALGSAIDLDPPLDSDTFEDDALATAFDRMIVKTRDGAHQFATAVQAAIARAEDVIYVETPALDPLSAGVNDEVDLVGAIIARWAERPTLSVVLCVPEKFLPDQPDTLERIRQDGVSAAIQALQDAAPYGNVELFTPTAGSGRPWHMASTTVIIDDVVAFTGSTHLWRRGLTFDSSIGVGLFDENVIDGRPTAVRAARLALFAQSLNIVGGLALPDPTDMLDSVRELNRVGGLQRVKPGVYPGAALASDTAATTEHDLWNPDGLPDGTSDWYLLLADLFSNVQDDDNNAVR